MNSTNTEKDLLLNADNEAAIYVSCQKHQCQNFKNCTKPIFDTFLKYLLLTK